MNTFEFQARTAHVALYESAADCEIALLLTELSTGRFTGIPFESSPWPNHASQSPP